MLNKILLACKLARFNSPTGYLLVFFPACYGSLLASNSSVDFRLLLLFFLGSVITRGAGCVINDIFDQQFDAKVSRTRHRPLASKALSNKEALIALFALSFCALLILLTLTKTAILLGCVAAFFIVLYPLTKRITNLPQVFLGFTFNLGLLIAYASVNNYISLSAFCAYLGCCAWTIGYDTIYAFMDLEDDKKINIGGMARLLEHNNYKLWLYLFYTIFLTLIIYANLIADKDINLIAIALSGVLLYWQVGNLDITDKANCLKMFKMNNYVGMVITLSMVN